MTDFKVGDKVEVRTGIAAPWEGVQLTVTEANRKARPFGGGFDLRAVREDGRDGLYDNHEVKLVRPEPKFKVGDWVKVHGRNDSWDGTVGTVQKVSPKSYSHYGNLYTIHQNGKVGSENVLSFFEGVLEATEAPKPEFKVGDKVRQKTGVNGHSRLDVLTVESLHPDMHHSVFVTNSKGSVLPYQPCELEKVTFASGGGIKQEFGTFLPDYAVIDSYLTSNLFASGGAPAFAKGGKVSKPEAVEHPAHYGGDTTYEVIKVAEAWGFEKNAYLFNALKYLARAGKKGDKVEDLKKLAFYVQREIALEEAK